MSQMIIDLYFFSTAISPNSALARVALGFLPSTFPGNSVGPAPGFRQPAIVGFPQIQDGPAERKKDRSRHGKVQMSPLSEKRSMDWFRNDVTSSDVYDGIFTMDWSDLDLPLSSLVFDEFDFMDSSGWVLLNFSNSHILGCGFCFRGVMCYWSDRIFVCVIEKFHVFLRNMSSFIIYRSILYYI